MKRLIAAQLAVLNALAPTEEPILLAYQLDPGRLVAIVVVSVVLSLLIVFHTDFGGVQGRARRSGSLQSPTVETLLAIKELCRRLE